MSTTLRAPFPYFGGKRSVAALVWERFGDVRNYIEPFAGSCAVLLSRPHTPKIETVNDLDPYIANFWRATERAAEDVAAYADWPVNEADLHARHRWLVLSEAAIEFREKMRTDPEYVDAKIAGWWVWGICMWIGGGWCSYSGPDPRIQIPDLYGDTGAAGRGVHASGMRDGRANGMAGRRGVHRKPEHEWEQRPGISDGSARGVLRDGRPQLADEYSRGRGVHGNDSAGNCAQRRAWLIEWFNQLKDRLRSVRVCCGDWKRVCSSRSVTTKIGMTGLFLDPPYRLTIDGVKSRDDKLYASESATVAVEVREFCLQEIAEPKGGYAGPRYLHPKMRIALCGLAGEHDVLHEQHGWECVPWKSGGGYGNRRESNENRDRERIWFSPHCVMEAQGGLF